MSVLPIDVATRVADYINRAEAAVCGEWCADDWPKCTDERHDEGRALLDILRAPPGWVPYERRIKPC